VRPYPSIGRASAGLLFALLFFLPALRSQTPLFDAFNLGEGKKTLRVQAVAQDERHRLYFGTNDGLVRYDGLNYEPIEICDSIPKHSVTALLWHDKELWIGGAKGQLFRLGENGSSITLHKDSSLTSARISDILAFEDRVFIGTYGDGVYLFHDSALTHINTTNGLGDDYTYDLAVHGDVIWVGTDAGITALNADGSVRGLVSMKNGLPDNIVKSIQPLDEEWLALGTHDLGVCRFNTVTQEFLILYTSENPWEHGTIESMVLGEGNSLWIGTKSSGLLHLQYAGDGIQTRAFSEINGLGSNRINTLFKDAEESIWIGNSNGVTLYRGGSFEYLTQSDGLPGANIYDVLEDRDGNYWFASEEGVIRFSYGPSGQGLISTFLSTEDGGQAQVVSLFEDDAGIIWMGTYGSGLYYLSPGSSEIRSIGADDGLTNSNVLDIASDPEGGVWLATLGGGVVHFEWEYGGSMVDELDIYAEVGSNYIYTVFLDSKGTLWIGTDGAGLAVYDTKGEYFKPAPEGPLASASIYAITEDEDGGMWFATAESGLFRYAQGAFTKWDEKRGVRSDFISGLKTGGDGEVYAIHSYGVDVLEKGMDMFKGHSSEMKGFNFEPNLNAVHYCRGHIWIGTESGAVKFECDHSGGDTITPKVALTGLRVLYEKQSLESGQSFDYSENHFVFDYKGIWMKAPERVIYKYKLEGFDMQWSFPTQTQVATYSSLPPGEYTFKVVASNGNGSWSEETASSYSFVILRPFWMQWWFYALLVLLLGAGITLFIRWRTQRLILEKQRLEDEVEKRTVEIREQKDIIEAKSEEILSSINYARRIQEAILPPMKLVKESLPNSFVLYKPKDIVAGDFYWMNQSKEENSDYDLIHFAAADCTGHGVPGAMVSVVCSNALNRAAREFGLCRPADVLDKVLELVVARFTKSAEVKDGMDVALCAYTPATKKLEYAGAQNPLWIVTKRDLGSEGFNIHPDQPADGSSFRLYEIKADKQPIGRYTESKPFTNHSIQLETGDTIYVFSDGYADQFGGPRGKKLKSKPFKELLLSMQDKTMDEQHTLLDQQFETWRGDLEQVDDVCVMGLRV